MEFIALPRLPDNQSPLPHPNKHLILCIGWKNMLDQYLASLISTICPTPFSIIYTLNGVQSHHTTIKLLFEKTKEMSQGGVIEFYLFFTNFSSLAHIYVLSCGICSLVYLTLLRNNWLFTNRIQSTEMIIRWRSQSRGCAYAADPAFSRWQSHVFQRLNCSRF